MLTVLDDKFWVWETLDEAIKVNVDKMTDDEIMQTIKALGINYKGSENLWDLLLDRIIYAEAKPY